MNQRATCCARSTRVAAHDGALDIQMLFIVVVVVVGFPVLVAVNADAKNC